LKGLDVAEIATCAALYAAIGYMIWLFLPITTPGIGTVRFWPNVVIPAAFAVLFGPLVGGLGAAIGIFLSDMLIHHDPVLSLCAGVTSNFLGFYLIGYFSRRNIDWTKLISVSSSVIMIISLASLATVSYIAPPSSIVNALNVFSVILVVAFMIAVGIGYVWPDWKSYQLGSMIGLGVGSIIIGVVVWAYSQVFTLPTAVGGGFQLPLYAALVNTVWTFGTEIPFLVLLGPPIVKACYRAFPSLKPVEERKSP
jgi:uncharacterized membrane protein